MPGTRWRTIAIAQRMPNAVFSGTATTVISSVSFSACTAVGFEIAAQNGRQPCSKARQKMSDTGATRIVARYASESVLTVMTGGPAAEAADSEEDAERDDEHQERERRGARRVAAVQALEDLERRDLRLERQVAADQDHGSEFADRTRECECDAREQRGQQVREDDAAIDRQARGAERRGRLLHLVVELDQHRLHGA